MHSHWLMAIVWMAAGLLVLLDRRMWLRPGLAPGEPEARPLSSS